VQNAFFLQKLYERTCEFQSGVGVKSTRGVLAVKNFLEGLRHYLSRFRSQGSGPQLFAEDIENDENVLIGRVSTPTARLSRQIGQIRHPPIVDVERGHMALFQIRGAVYGGSFPSGVSHTPGLGKNLPFRLPVSEGFDNVPWYILRVRLQMGVEFARTSVIELVGCIHDVLGHDVVIAPRRSHLLLAIYAFKIERPSTFFV
jgi:hypothetical protein